jgi:hypothetical protein
MKSFYDILGVSKFASDVEIKKAYILRSKMMHPDRFNQTSQKAEWDMANEMLKELNHAYGVLKDPVSRSAYDRTMGRGYSNQSAPPPQSSTQSSPPPRQTPPPQQPQQGYKPAQRGVDLPQWVYTLIFFGVIGLIGKGCETVKNKAPSTPSNLSAGASHPVTPRYTPFPKYTPSAYSSPTASPRAVQTVPSDYPEPANGYVFKNRFASRGHGQLTISNGCSSHSVVKLVNVALNTAVYAGFVRANSVLNISGIPDGTYRLLFAAGHGWDDIDGRFKQRDGASEFREPLVYTTTPITEGNQFKYQYDTMSITLNPAVGGTAKADNISTSEFEKY